MACHRLLLVALSAHTALGAHDDAAAWVQKNLAVHQSPSKVAARGKGKSEQFPSLDGFPFAMPTLDANTVAGMIGGLVKFVDDHDPKAKERKEAAAARRAARENRTVRVPVPPTPQTEEERQNEPQIRKTLRENLQWYVRQNSGMDPSTRGSIVSFWTGELMTIRRSTHPQVRRMFDKAMQIPVQDISLANVHAKLLSLQDAWESVGYHKAAHLFDYVLPYARLLKFGGEDFASSLTLNSTAEMLREVAASVSDIAALVNASDSDLTDAVRFMEDLANMLEANAESNYTAAEVFERVRGANSSKQLIPVAEVLYTLRNFLARENDPKAFFQGAALAINESISGAGPIATLVADIPEMWARRAETDFLLDRVFRVVNELDRPEVRTAVGASLAKINDFEAAADPALSQFERTVLGFAAQAEAKTNESLANLTEALDSLESMVQGFVDDVMAKVNEVGAQAMAKALEGSSVADQAAQEALHVFMDKASTAYLQIGDLLTTASMAFVNATRWSACHLKDAQGVLEGCQDVLKTKVPNAAELSELFGIRPLQDFWTKEVPSSAVAEAKHVTALADERIQSWAKLFQSGAQDVAKLYKQRKGDAAALFRPRTAA